MFVVVVVVVVQQQQQQQPLVVFKPVHYVFPTSSPGAETAEVLKAGRASAEFQQWKCTTLNGGSLGSWVDEDRSKLRVGM